MLLEWFSPRYSRLNKCLRSNLDELGDADDVEDQGDAGSRAVGGQGEERVLLGEPPEVRP